MEEGEEEGRGLDLSLAGHTATYIPDRGTILVIGGYSQRKGEIQTNYQGYFEKDNLTMKIIN